MTRCEEDFLIWVVLKERKQSYYDKEALVFNIYIYPYHGTYTKFLSGNQVVALLIYSVKGSCFGIEASGLLGPRVEALRTLKTQKTTLKTLKPLKTPKH